MSGDDDLEGLSASYLRDGGLDPGYALTVHQAQGLTCDRAMLLGSDALYREAGYVGLSRGRQRNDLHLVERAAPDHPDAIFEHPDPDTSITSTCRTRRAHILPGAGFTPYSDQPQEP